jgi:DNA-3-methyladenine glycosylase
VTPVERAWLARDPREVAPELLGKVLAHDTAEGRRSGRIVEVEAYCGPIDAGAHTYRGRTERNATMFGRAGLLYVYFTYGMHWCANVVCGDEDDGVAVLVRALAPIDGVEAMRAARGPAARRDRDLCSGPAKLCQALGLHGSHDGADLLSGGPVQLLDDGTPPPADPVQAARIGLSAGAEHPWRWYVPGDPNVSRP